MTLHCIGGIAYIKFYITSKTAMTPVTFPSQLISIQKYWISLNKTFGSNSYHLPDFIALSGDDPEQNAGTIHASIPEHVPVFKAPRGNDPK